jgi:hypothetical protein
VLKIKNKCILFFALLFIKVNKYYKFLVLSIYGFENKNLRQIFLNMFSSCNNIYQSLNFINYKMSSASNSEFMRVQRRLFNLYDNCNLMTHERLEETLNEFTGIVRQMVITRQLDAAQPRPLPRTVTPERPRSPIGPPPALQQPPRPPAELRPVPRTVTPERPRSHIGPAPQEVARPAAELRPAAVARTTVPTAPVPVSIGWPAAYGWPASWETYRSLNKVCAIGRVKFNADCKEVCAICLDTHKKCDSVTTECGHEYCKGCWFSWMSNTTGNRKCPTCRKQCPKTTTFKLMADRKKRQQVPQAI